MLGLKPTASVFVLFCLCLLPGQYGMGVVSGVVHAPLQKLLISFMSIHRPSTGSSLRKEEIWGGREGGGRREGRGREEGGVRVEGGREGGRGGREEGEREEGGKREGGRREGWR